MQACDQTTDNLNTPQYNMYQKLIVEEFWELQDAIKANNKTEQLDALVDILVVTIGAIHSMGADGEGAWNEVMRSNFAKIDSTTGKVRKREDGKVLKPEGWTPPVLDSYVSKDKDIVGYPV